MLCCDDGAMTVLAVVVVFGAVNGSAAPSPTDTPVPDLLRRHAVRLVPLLAKLPGGGYVFSFEFVVLIYIFMCSCFLSGEFHVCMCSFLGFSCFYVFFPGDFM